MEKLLVIFGGLSPEHDVSCLSAASLTSNVDRSKFELKCLGITREGRWLLTEATSEEIKSGEWKNRVDNIVGMMRASLSISRIAYYRYYMVNTAKTAQFRAFSSMRAFRI